MNNKINIIFLSGTGNTESMGVEELEESEMEPFMESISNDIDGKNILIKLMILGNHMLINKHVFLFIYNIYYL